MAKQPARSGQAVIGPTSVLGVSLKPNESSFYERMYLLADAGRTGAVTGLAARSLFSHTTLTKPVLSKIWETADRQKRKFLDREDFFIALRLISLAQANLPVALQSVKQYAEVQLPYFDNIPADGPPAPPASAVAASPAAPTSTPAGAPSSIYAPLPDILPQTKPKKPNAAVIHSPQPPLHPVNNAAANTAAVGAGPLSHAVALGVPVLPTAATQSVGGGSGGFPAPVAVAGSGSGSGPLDWSISDEENVQYSSMFTQADSDQDGYVSGKEALQFFQQSGLERTLLRKIWILADVDKDGKLNHDEFAVAMHLVFKARKKWVLPDKLPEVLIKAAKASSKDPNDIFGGLPGSSANAPLDLFGPASSTASSSSGAEFGFTSDPFATKAAPLPEKSALSSVASAPGGPSVASLGALPNSSRQTHSRSNSLSKMLSMGMGVDVPLPIGGDAALSGGLGLSSPAINLNSGFQTPPTAAHLVPLSAASSSAAALFGSPGAADPNASAQLANAFNAAQHANIVRQESMLRSALDAANAELARVSESAKDSAKLAEPALTKLAELEEQATKQREKIAVYQEEIRQSTSKMAEAQRRIPEMKIEARESEAQIAVLETSLTTLRSQLKDVERLRSGLEQIVATRRETLARLVAEKNEVSELLEQSKVDMTKLRTQDQLLREAAETAVESTKMLQEQLDDSKTLVEALKKNPPKPHAPVVLPASAVAASPFLQADPRGTATLAAVHAKRLSMSRSAANATVAEVFGKANAVAAATSSSSALPTLVAAPAPVVAAAPSASGGGAGALLDDDDAFNVDDLPDFTAHAPNQRKKSSSIEGRPRKASLDEGEAGESKHEKKGEPEAKHAMNNHFGESFLPHDGLPSAAAAAASLPSAAAHAPAAAPASAPAPAAASSSSSSGLTDDFGSASFDDDPFASDSFGSAESASNAAFDPNDPFASTSAFDDPWGETKKDEQPAVIAAAAAAPGTPAAAAAALKSGDPALDFLGITVTSPKPKPATQSSPVAAPQPTSSSPAPGAAAAPHAPAAVDLGKSAAASGNATLLTPAAVAASPSPASASFDEMNGFDDAFDPFADPAPNVTSPTAASVGSSASSSSSAIAAAGPGASAASAADDPFSAPDFPEDPFSDGPNPFASTNPPAVGSAAVAASGGGGGKDWADFDTSW